MQREMRIQKSQTSNTCIECPEQATASCALCGTALCRHHQHKIQEEETIELTSIILCSSCQSLSVAVALDELCDYIAWYNPRWALA
jgi:hypothetical protein